MRTLIALIVATLFTTAVTANEPFEDKDRSRQSAQAEFDSLDRNDDGRLSKSEARNEDTLSAQFASVDADSDGYVSESEYTALADTSPQTERPSPDYDRDSY